MVAPAPDPGPQLIFRRCYVFRREPRSKVPESNSCPASTVRTHDPKAGDHRFAAPRERMARISQNGIDVAACSNWLTRLQEDPGRDSNDGRTYMQNWAQVMISPPLFLNLRRLLLTLTLHLSKLEVDQCRVRSRYRRGYLGRSGSGIHFNGLSLWATGPAQKPVAISMR
jgi:hypothetical protein